MIIALSLVIAVVALVAVAAPILSKARRSRPAVAAAGESLEELFAQRDAVFQALRDLNFDHQVGKIADEDYTVFEANLKHAAAGALRAIDAWEANLNGELNQSLEREIAARRAALSAPGVGCPKCGRVAAAGDLFCTGCGHSLAAAPSILARPNARSCPSCGRAILPEDRFCPGCGSPLGQGQAANAPQHRPA